MADPSESSPPVVISDELQQLVEKYFYAAYDFAKHKPNASEAAVVAENNLIRAISWLETLVEQRGKRIQELEAEIEQGKEREAGLFQALKMANDALRDLGECDDPEDAILNIQNMKATLSIPAETDRTPEAINAYLAAQTQEVSQRLAKAIARHADPSHAP